MMTMLLSDRRPYLTFTLFLYPFQSIKCRLDPVHPVQELCVEHLFVIPLFLYIFSATTSQKLSGIKNMCSGGPPSQESMLSCNRFEFTVYSTLLEKRPIELIGMVSEVGQILLRCYKRFLFWVFCFGFGFYKTKPQQKNPNKARFNKDSTFWERFVGGKISSFISEYDLKTCRKVELFCDGLWYLLVPSRWCWEKQMFLIYKNNSGCYYWVCFSPLSNAIFIASAASMPSSMKDTSLTVSHWSWKYYSSVSQPGV